MDKNKISIIHELLYLSDLQNSCDKLKSELYFLPQKYVNQLIHYFKKDSRRYSHLHMILVKAASDPKKRYNRLVKQLLRAGLIPDFESSYGTALSGAILQNNYSLFLFLLKYCNVNHKNMSGRTPLFYASFDGKLEMVYSLIKAGAIVDQVSLNYQGEEVLPIQMIQNEEPSFMNVLEFKNVFFYLKNIFFSKLIQKKIKKENFKSFNFLPNVHKLNFILAKPLMIDSSSGDLVNVVEKCIGRTTRLALNKFNEAITTGHIVNTDTINRAIILKYLNPNIKADSIYLSWYNVGLMSRLFLNPEKLPLLKDLLSGYSFNRHLILFSDSSFYGSLEEIVSLWIEVIKKIPPQEVRKVLPRKPKSLTEIHWVLYSLKKEYMKKPVPLNQPMLFASPTMNEYEIYLPKDRSDLLYYSLMLKNCLNQEEFEKRILAKLQYIAIILKKGKAVFCVRYDTCSILEVKGWNNKVELPDGFMELLCSNFTPLNKKAPQSEASLISYP